MIDASNFFEASKGAFRVIPSKWVEQLKNAIDVVEEFDDYFGSTNSRVVMNEITLGNRKWIPNFYSHSARWGSTSAYWVSEDGQYLLRVSDHWSLAQKGVHQCGNIRKCWWALTGRKQAGVDGLWGGIVKFSDLSERS